jgi:predicted outer membrane repeat protein
VYGQPGSDITVRSSAFVNTSAVGCGGGALYSQGKLTCTDSTFADSSGTHI